MSKLSSFLPKPLFAKQRTLCCLWSCPHFFSLFFFFFCESTFGVFLFDSSPFSLSSSLQTSFRAFAWGEPFLSFGVDEGNVQACMASGSSDRL